jgi:hypothetical protein
MIDAGAEGFCIPAASGLRALSGEVGGNRQLTGEALPWVDDSAVA